MRLEEFLVNGSSLDLTAIEELGFYFGDSLGSATGAIGLDDIELVNEELEWPTGVDGDMAELGSNILLYPNPAAERCVVRFPRMIEEGRVEVYSVMGLRVKCEQVNQLRETEIQLNDLAKGMYVVRVVDGERVYRARVVVQ